MTERQRIYVELRAGRLHRPDHCDRCGERRRIVAHVVGQGSDREITWLCRRCDRAEHGGDVRPGVQVRDAVPGPRPAPRRKRLLRACPTCKLPRQRRTLPPGAVRCRPCDDLHHARRPLSERSTGGAFRDVLERIR